EDDVTQAMVGAGLHDDRAHAGSDVEASRADGQLAGSDGKPEHAGALAPADERERRELDADHRNVSFGRSSTRSASVASMRQAVSWWRVASASSVYVSRST